MYIIVYRYMCVGVVCYHHVHTTMHILLTYLFTIV